MPEANQPVHPAFDYPMRWPPGLREQELTRLASLLAQRTCELEEQGGQGARRQELTRLRTLLRAVLYLRLRRLQALEAEADWAEPPPETSDARPPSTRPSGESWHPQPDPHRRSLWDRLRFWKH